MIWNGVRKMTVMENWKRWISLALVLALLLPSGMTVRAEEETEETEPLWEQETSAEPEETESVEEETEAEATGSTEEETQPDQTEPAVEETEPTAAAEDTPMTVAEALATEPGTEDLLLEGIVVFAMGPQAVLQDPTGGIRLSFGEVPEISPGDVLLVTGRRSGGFAVESFEKTGTASLPAVETTLEEGCPDQRILVRDVTLGRNSLSHGDYTCQMTGSVPADLEPGRRVDAWGVFLDGIFYADTIRAAEIRTPELPETGDWGSEALEPADQELQEDSTPAGGWNFYFGQLHAHTNISDGLGSVGDAFAYARQVENLDFFAVTDHSNSFDNGEAGAVDLDGREISQEWAAGKAAAEAVTDETFVGIFGYEMTWPEDLAIGHISTFATPGWQTRDQSGMSSLKGYLAALAAVPDSVSQFNHPGVFYGDFRNFSEYSPQQDALMHLLEVGGEGNFTAYDAYTTALDAGWHLAPSNNQNNHNGNWGNESQARTVVLAGELTETAIYDAVRAHRVYATEDADLKILYHLNDRIMGSTTAATTAMTAHVRIEDGSGDPIGRIEVVTDGGKVAASMTLPEDSATCALAIDTAGSYYYLRILREEQIVAVTAPVWVESYEDLGISSFTADNSKPDQGTGVALTLTLFNHESVPFVVERVSFSVGSQEIGAVMAPGSIAPVEERKIPMTYTQAGAGAVTITARVQGTIAGTSRCYEKEITLQYQPVGVQMLDIAEVRQQIPGEAYRIRGYVTAGTANPYNSFSGSIYLQDDTGGIAVTDFSEKGIQVGTPMEIEGVLRSVGGNLVLAMTDYVLLNEDYYRYVPKTMTHQRAMAYDDHGGELLQVEGTVVSVTKTPDGSGVSRFTLRDVVGELATVLVEDGIGSSTYGTNELASQVKKNRTVRAMGLLHRDEYGGSVLRVRNCDEVAYVPPLADDTNPKTGHWFSWLKFRK